MCHSINLNLKNCDMVYQIGWSFHIEWVIWFDLIFAYFSWHIFVCVNVWKRPADWLMKSWQMKKKSLSILAFADFFFFFVFRNFPLCKASATLYTQLSIFNDNLKTCVHFFSFFFFFIIISTFSSFLFFVSLIIFYSYCVHF